jgi:hypothetical protein
VIHNISSPIKDTPKMAGVSARTRWFSIIEQYADSRRCHGILLIAAAVLYLLSYLGQPLLPGNNLEYPNGWWGWWDQGQYLKCAAAIAHWELGPKTYWYPLGYPALGALFYRWVPQHAFFLPDFALVLGAIVLFFKIARRMISSLEAILLISIFVVAYAGTTTLSLVTPWTTIPTHLLYYAMIWLLGFRDPNQKRIYASAACLGLMYTCRALDAACMGLILAVALLQLPGWRDKFKVGLVSSLIVAAPVGCILLITHSIFGSWFTPYEQASGRIGFGGYTFVKKLFLLLVDGRPIFREANTAYFSHFPWLVLAPIGVVYLLRRYNKNAIGVLLSGAMTYATYFSYNDFWPHTTFRFGQIHYLFWTLPLLALFTYVGLKHSWKDRVGRWSYVLVLLILLPICLFSLRERVRGRAVLPSDSTIVEISRTATPRVDWISFPGASTTPKIYLAGRELTQFSEYVAPIRPDATAVLLARAIQERDINLDVQGSANLQSIEFGTLDWRWRWTPRTMAFALQDYFFPPTIALLGKGQNLDIGGPQGGPDGEPDEIVQVTLRQRLFAEIRAWEIETDDRRGHWVTTANSHGWWLIKVQASPDKGDTDQVQIALCFPDFGDFEKANGFALRAWGDSGCSIFERHIRK